MAFYDPNNLPWWQLPTDMTSPQQQAAQVAQGVRVGSIPQSAAIWVNDPNRSSYMPGYQEGLAQGFGIPMPTAPISSTPVARTQAASQPVTSVPRTTQAGFKTNDLYSGGTRPQNMAPPVGDDSGPYNPGYIPPARSGTSTTVPTTGGRGTGTTTQTGPYVPRNPVQNANAYFPYGNPNVNPNWYRPPNDQTKYPGGWGTNVASSYLNYLQPNILNSNQNWQNQSGNMNQFFNSNSMQNPYTALMNLLGGGWGASSSGPGTGTNNALSSLLLGGGGKGNPNYYQGGVGSLLNQIMNLGLPNQRTVEGLVPGQTGVGTGMQGTTADALTQALANGGLTPQYVQAMRELVLQPSQEALGGRLNQQGGGVVSPTSGLQQELQRRNERDFNNQLIASGQGNYGNYLSQAGGLGQNALMNALTGFGSVAQNAAPYFNLAGNLGLGLSGQGLTAQNQQASQYQNLLNTMMGGNLQNNQQALQAYLGQLGQYGNLAGIGLGGDTSLARAQYEAETMADLARMNSIGVFLQNVLGGGGGGGGFGINIGLPNINIGGRGTGGIGPGYTEGGSYLSDYYPRWYTNPDDWIYSGTGSGGGWANDTWGGRPPYQTIP